MQGSSTKHQRAWATLPAAVLIVLLSAGCRPRFVATTIENDTGRPITMVELDYPGAGFGTSTLAAHAVYSYRFKAIGSGALALSYTDETGKPRKSAGPTVDDGQGGSLTVHIRDAGSVSWEPVFSRR